MDGAGVGEPVGEGVGVLVGAGVGGLPGAGVGELVGTGDGDLFDEGAGVLVGAANRGRGREGVLPSENNCLHFRPKKITFVLTSVLASVALGLVPA